MKKILFLSLALVISGCATPNVAHYSLNNRVFPAQISLDKKIYFSIDEKYLDSKAIIHYGVDYDEAALKNERISFKTQLFEKIKKSLPANCIYSEPTIAPPGAFDKYLLFVPYISISLMEHEGYINVRTAIKIRVYNNARDKLKDHKVVSDVNKPFSGRYSILGLPEHYRAFTWNEDLNRTLNAAMNESVDKAISDSISVLKDLI